MGEYTPTRGVGVGFGVRGRAKVEVSGEDTTEAVDPEFNAADHNVDDVLDLVDEGVVTAEDALASEQAGKGRKSLIEALEERL